MTMKTAHVYHADDAYISSRGRAACAGEGVFPNEFDLVARVELQEELTTDEALARAFNLTNHVDRPWWTNPGVTKVVSDDVRSTSTGDIVVIDDRAYRCESVGWYEALERPRSGGWVETREASLEEYRLTRIVG